jgi:hypothetical protein
LHFAPTVDTNPNTATRRNANRRGPVDAKITPANLIVFARRSAANANVVTAPLR